MPDNRSKVHRKRFPWGVSALLGLGAWLVAALMFALFIPGSVWLGFLFGVISGAPLFFPAHRYFRQAAAWEVARTEAMYERAAGGPDQLEDIRRRTGEALGMDDPARQTMLRRFGEVLRWTPVALSIFLALACLIAGAAGEGIDATMAGSLGGLFAVWALLFRLSGMKPIPGPHQAAEYP